MIKSKPRRIGKLPPKYNFVLNPHTDVRFTRCPNCEKNTRVRKLPLFIHVDPFRPIALNKTCRFCPDCDLLIVHQDELEEVLLRMFPESDPETISKEYLVVGTVERQAFRKGLKSPRAIGEMLENTHDFKAHWEVEYRPAGWYPADADP